MDFDEGCVSSTLSSQRYTSKIPVRIKSGCFKENCLSITTGCEELNIDWASVEYICLGVIDEDAGGGDAPKSNMRNMIRKLFFGDKPQDEQTKPQKKTQYILDIYAKDRACAYRFDSTNINYKAFLEEVSYISLHNFKRLLQALSEHARESYFNRSAVALLIKRQDKCHRYASVTDFELDCQQCRVQIKREIHWSELGKPIDYIFTDRGRRDTAESPRACVTVVEGVLEEVEETLEGEEYTEEYIEESEIMEDEEDMTCPQVTEEVPPEKKEEASEEVAQEKTAEEKKEEATGEEVAQEKTAEEIAAALDGESDEK